MRLPAALLFLCACLPRPHDVAGHACGQDSDCGAGFVCWKGACAVAGTVAAVTVDGGALGTGTDEGGVGFAPGGVTRLSTQVGLAAWDAGAPLPAPAAQVAAATNGQWVYALGGWDGGAPSSAVLALPAGTPGPWSSTTSLPAPRRSLAAVAYQGQLFALGGLDGAGMPAADVSAAAISSDGSVGTWIPRTALPAGRSDFAATASGSYLYAIGGVGGTGLLSDVLSAPLRGDGTLGGWFSAGALPAPGRADLGAVAYQGWLYVAGGSCGGSACGGLAAPLRADGTLGPWVVLPDLPTPRSGVSLAAWAGALYALGGKLTDGTPVAEVDSALLDADGAPGPWFADRALPAPRVSPAAVAVAGTLYALGGDNGAGARAEVFAAPLWGGLVGPWSDSARLPNAFYGGAVASYGGAIFVGGGNINQGPSIASILQGVIRGQVGADGNVTAWTDAGTLLLPVSEAAGAAWGDHYYVIGGCTGPNYCGTFISDVEIAAFKPDGTLGPFSQTTPLPSGLAINDAVALTYLGNLYVLGGYDAYQPYDGVWVSHLDPVTGTPDPWQMAAKLPTPVALAAAVVSRGAIYVIGGTIANSGYSNQVLIGRIGSDGLVASWTTLPPMPIARRGPVAAVADENVYVFGGCNDDAPGSTFCGTFYPNVDAARILADGTLGPWTAAAPLQQGRTHPFGGAVGRWLLVGGGYQGNPLDRLETAPIRSPGDVAGWSSGPPLPSPREWPAAAGVGDRVYIAGGAGALLDVAWATVDGGALSPWTAGPSLPAPRRQLALFASDGWLIAAGGDDGTGHPAADVWIADARASTLGTWTPAAPLPQPLEDQAGAAWGGRAYVVGGSGSAHVFVGTVVDGGIAGWIDSQALPAARSALAAAASGGFLYVAAGQVGGVDSTDLLVAPITANGVGSWSLAGALAAPRESVALAAASGYLYLAGGRRIDLEIPDGGLRAFSEVEIAPLHQDGTLGEVTTAVPLPAPVAHHAIALAGGSLVVAGGNSNGPSAAVSVTALRSPAAIGKYSLSVDFGSVPTSIDSLALAGGAANLGDYVLAERVAAPDAVYGVPLLEGAFWNGVDTPLGQSGDRYVWLDVLLDDRAAAARDVAAVNRDLSSVVFSLHR